MKKIMDVMYLTEKEASKRYGHSIAWFSRRRHLNLPPRSSQIDKGCNVLYPLEKTDKWFLSKLDTQDE